MPRQSKGDRRTVTVRVPAKVHEQLMAIKSLTGEEINEQLVDLISEHTATRMRHVERERPHSLFEEAHAKSA